MPALVRPTFRRSILLAITLTTCNPADTDTSVETDTSVDTDTTVDTDTLVESLLWTVAGAGDAVVSDVCTLEVGGYPGLLAVGWFAGEATFGAGTATEVSATAADVDGFVVVLTHEGQIARFFHLAGSGDQRVQHCVGLTSIGTFAGTMTVAGTGLSLVASSTSDAFRFDAAVNTESLGLTHLIAGTTGAVAMDCSAASGSFTHSCCVAAAEFEGEATVFPGSANATRLTSKGSKDLVTLLERSYSGTPEAPPAIARMGGPGEERLGVVRVADDGSIAGPPYNRCAGVIVSGGASEGAVFGEAGPNEVTPPSQGGLDAFVAWQSSGDLGLEWVRTDGGPGDDVAWGLAAAVSPIYVVGTFGGGVGSQTATFAGATPQTLTSFGGSDVYTAVYRAGTYGDDPWTVSDLAHAGSAGDDGVTAVGSRTDYYHGRYVASLDSAGTFAGPTFTSFDGETTLASAAGGTFLVHQTVYPPEDSEPPQCLQTTDVTVRSVDERWLAGDFGPEASLVRPGWPSDLAGLNGGGRDGFVAFVTPILE